MTSTYFHMTDHTGSSGFLPTVTFDCSNNGIFDTSRRTTQLAAIGITGFYEADFTNNVTTIDVGTFQNDTKVVVVTINRVTSIGASAFSGCTALRSITLDTAIDTTGGSVAANPNYKRYLLTSIGNSAFYRCGSLRNLYIPDTVKLIPDALCQDCSGLEVAVMGYGCNRSGNNYVVDASINQYAFAGCTKLSYFIIPETVGTVGNNAFSGCTSLSYVAILGKPTFGGSDVFTVGSGARYVYDTTQTGLTIPSGATTNPYTEIVFDASGSTSLDSTYVSRRFNGIASPWVKVKIQDGITTIASSAFRPGGGIGANYSKIVAVSFPSTLTTISSQAFETSGTTDLSCNVGGFYLPNSITTVNASAFNVNLTVFNSTLTKQIVSTSGNSTITPGTPFPFASTIKALIIADCSTISQQYCDTAKNLQLVNFFQKNAYSRFTTIANASFQNTFIAANVGTGTHYIYIPKQVSSMTNIFNGTTATMLFTVYDKTADGTAGNNTEGLGTNTANNASYLTTAGLGTITSATIHLICNWYDANGTLQGAMKGYGYPYHVLFHPSITTITDRFFDSANTNSIIKSMAIHHSGTPTVVLNTNAFNLCTALAYVYLNKRVKTIGVNALRDTLLNVNFDLIDAAPLEAIYYAAFYTNPNRSSNLRQITIPNTVKAMGAYVFGCETTGRKTSFTSLSFATDISFWGDYFNTYVAVNFTDANTSSARYMAIPAYFCMNCDYLQNVSFFDTVLDVNGTPVPADGNALARADNNFPITTRYNKQILTNPIRRIGYWAFYRNYRLQSIRLPEGVTTIHDKAFLDTYSLTYLYLPDSLIDMSLNSGAFHYMNYNNQFGYTGKQVSIRLPQKYIEYVKEDTGSAETGTFNTGQVSDGQQSNSQAATYFFTVSFSNSTVSGKVTSGKLGRFTTQTNPPFIQYHVITLDGITDICGGSTTNRRAFDGFTNLKTVTIADTVTNIGDGAFYNCTGLTNVFFSTTSQLVTIGNEAFRDCTKLTGGVYLSNTVKTIGNGAFRNAKLSGAFDLSSATSLEAIYHAAFHTDVNQTSDLSQITIPSSVKVIGSYAFGCGTSSGQTDGKKEKFTSISFAGGTGFEFWGDYNNNLTSFALSTLSSYDYNTSNLTNSRNSARYMAIPAHFCSRCTHLKNVSFLDTVLDENGTPVPADGNGALARADNNLPITTRYNKQILNDKIKRIGNDAFALNHRLQSIRIPEGVTTIDTNAFYDAYSLTYLYLPDSLTTMVVDSAAFNFMNYSNQFSYAGKQVSIRVPENFIESVKGNTGNANTGTFNTGNVSTFFFTVSFSNSSVSGKVTSGKLGRFTIQLVNSYIQYHVITLSGITGILGGSTTYARAFDGYTNLKTVTIADTVTTIEDAAFYNCTGLTSVFLSTTSQLVTIGVEAFRDCTSLTNGVYLSNTVKTIGVRAFANALLSNTFDLSSATSLEAIYHAAFYTSAGYTSNLRQITIPSSVKVIGSAAFACNEGSGNPGAKNSFNSFSFAGGPNFEFWGDYDDTLTSATTLAAYGYNPADLATSRNSLRHMAIPAYLFDHCFYLKSVSFLDTVDASGNDIPTINANGMLQYPDLNSPMPTRLNKQILTNKIKRFGIRPFYRCRWLQSIRVPDGVTILGNSSFFDAYSCTYLYLPDSLTTIGTDSFSYMNLVNNYNSSTYANYKYAAIRFPSPFLSGIRTTTMTASQFGITINTSDAGIYLVRYVFTVDVSSTYGAISNGVFGRFVNNNIDYFQYHVILPNNVHSLLPGATLSTSSFGSLTNLTTITLPSTLRYIPLTSFEGCTYLTNVFIPTTSNLTTIEPYAFKNCSFLTSFFIPNSLHRITFEMFKGCTSLASITYGDNPGIISIDESAFYNTTRALTSIFIPASVVNIGRFAFIGDGGNAYPNKLNTVTFGAGSRLKAIGGFAFGHSGNDISNSATYLQNLVLPSTLRYMGGNTGDNGRIFQNAFRNKHTDNFIFPSSVTFLPFACFYADGSTTDISNVYVPMSITAIEGPRIHNGYRNNTKSIGGVGGYIFNQSRAGSLIYLPSDLSSVSNPTNPTGDGHTDFNNAFPGTNRVRSYYQSFSYSTNPLITLALSPSITSTHDAGSTTQRHAAISEGVTIIGNGSNSITKANSGNPGNLISVNIPSTVTTISNEAFNGSSALVYVTFSENSHLTSIGASSFQDCSMIHDIRLPDTLTSIGQNAFYGCSNLTSISIPYNVTSLGSGAFYTNPNTSSTCTQIGSNLTGLEQDSYFGNSISWSSDGLTIAVGAFYYSTTGLVQVYRYISSSWTQIGHLTGTTGSLFGKSVSLSSNGNTLAVGAHGGGGFVRVFTYSNSTWNIIGNITISSGLSASQFGFSVSLSADGTTVAVGVPYYTDAKGLVQVFKYNNSAWNIVGNATDLSGQTNTSYFGVSVSLYSTGTNHILAVGASGHNNNAGYVQVFTSSGTSWTQLGTTINGKAGSHFGLPVSLTSSGTIHTLAAGGCLDGTNRGYVQVYRYSSSSWSKLGSDLNGLADYGLFGNSVSLSSDGNTLAVGSPQYNSAAGMVEVFKFSGSTWAQIGSDIIGTATSEFGASVSLSSDGRAVACGGVRYLNYTGIVQIYSCSVFKSVQMHQRLYNTISSSLSSYFTSPSSISFQIIPALLLTNTLNPSKLTLSQINNLYIRYRQSQLGFCYSLTIAASSGTTLTQLDVSNAIAALTIPTTTFLHIDISSNVTTISDDNNAAFLNNTRIYSVAISQTVLTINTNSFNGCTNLTYLSFHPDSSCNTINSYAFSNNNIIDLTLPDSLKTLRASAFQFSNTLTSVCIPKSVTILEQDAFTSCPKLTSVVLPSSLSSLSTGTYFSTSGSTTTGISFTSYSMTSDIPHFKLSDFSLPSGIVQNVIDSAVTYIDHRAYAYYPDITLYAVNSTYQQTITSGPASYQVNNIKMPIMPATFMMNGGSWQNFNLFPIYRSVPDLNVYSDVYGTVTAGMDNLDDGFLLMPGYSLCVFTNLYDEENISVFDVSLANIVLPYTTAVEKSTYIDNQFGKVPINVSASTSFGINNATSSVLIMFNGKILGKMFAG